jgi:hypothetical protein
MLDHSLGTDIAVGARKLIGIKRIDTSYKPQTMKYENIYQIIHNLLNHEYHYHINYFLGMRKN